MTLSIFYKQFSGNDSFETPEDRQSIYLDKLEPNIQESFAQWSLLFLDPLMMKDFMQLRYHSLILVML